MLIVKLHSVSPSWWSGELQDVASNSVQALMPVFWQQPMFIAIEADQAPLSLYLSGVLTPTCGTVVHGALAARVDM